MQPKYQLTDPYAGATRYFDDTVKPRYVTPEERAPVTAAALKGIKAVEESASLPALAAKYAYEQLPVEQRAMLETAGRMAGNVGQRIAQSEPVQAAGEVLGRVYPNAGKLTDYIGGSPADNPMFNLETGPVTAMLPGFFSKLERGLAAAPKQALTSGNAVKQWLSGNAGKYGIKQAEIEATGLGAHLENLGKGKTSKEELLDVVRAGDPGVEEVVKGQQVSAEQQAKFERLKKEITEIERKRDTGGQISSDRARSLINEAFERYGIKEDEYNNMMWNRSVGRPAVVPTKYSQYVLPGGENYREVLLTLPVKKRKVEFLVEHAPESDRPWRVRQSAELDHMRSFKTEEEARAAAEWWSAKGITSTDKLSTFGSPHWEEPNVLAHIRTNDRVGPNGEKQLFVEELQSDWAQKGRKEGFIGDVNLKVVTENGRKKLVDGAGNVVDAQYGDRFKSDQEYIDAFIDAYKNSQGSTIPAVPRAPYITNTKDWTDLGIKRIMQHAAENGYDQVAFINGAQSADRYNLSKHFDSIVLHDNTSGGVGLAKMEGPFTHGTVTAYSPNNEKVIDNHYVSSPDELANLIGQELAEKLLNTSPKSARSDSGFGVRQRKLSGLDLQVGGEGMKKFYDEIVPQAAGKFAKQYGAPFGVKPMETGNQFTIDITPSMRQDIAEKGVPAFAEGGSVEDFKDFAKDWYERRQWRGLGLGSAYGRDEMEKRLDSEVPYEKMKVIDNNPGIKAQYVPGALSDKIQITPNVKPKEVAHEWNHLARKYALGAKLNDYAVAHLPGTVKSSEDYLFDASDKKLHHKLGSFNSAMGMYDEISDPEEIQTRLMRMRYAAGFQPDKDVTKEDLQNFYKNYNGKDFQINQLLDIAPNDDAMLRLLNLMSNSQKPSDDTVYAAEGGPVNTDDDDYGQPFGDEIAKLYQGGLYRKGGEVHKYIVTSLTPVQKRLLKAHHAELGDESSFDDWMSDAGIPAIIHGHATKSMDSFLTPEQREMLDQVNS